MTRIHPVTLPKWGLEMSEGLVAKWLATEGADIASGTDLVDIETDKIVNTLESTAQGVLRRIVVPAGETVPVGALIAVLADAATPEAEIAAFVRDYRPVDASFEPKGDGARPPEAVVEEAPVKATPLARRIAGQEGIDLAGVVGSGPKGKVTKADVIARPEPTRDPEAIRASNAAAKASPVAVNFANGIGLDLSGLAPTGYKGRISLADAQAAARAAGLWSPAPVVVPVNASAPATATVQTMAEQPFAGMRKTIARALTQSKQTVPHFYTAMDVEVDGLMALRALMNSGGTVKLSVTDLLLRASALALAAHPQVNVLVSDTGITPQPQVDLCLAVAVEGGLLTPVIRDAASKPVSALARESARLIEGARARTLGAGDLQGGSFTLSNLGMFGVRSFDAIINPPQAAILAVGAPRREAREDADGGLRFASVLTLTLSADHRAIDGAVAAQFLQTLRQRIEAPGALVS